MAAREALDPLVASIVSEAGRHSVTAPTTARHEQDHVPAGISGTPGTPPGRMPGAKAKQSSMPIVPLS